MKIKLKESIYILKESEETYQFVFTSTRRIKKFKVDSLVKSVISNLKEEKLESELLSILNKEYDLNKINSCISALENEGIIRKYEEKNKIGSKYSKQISFIDELTESWEETLNLQNKIYNSKICVFGVGGIGT